MRDTGERKAAAFRHCSSPNISQPASGRSILGPSYAPTANWDYLNNMGLYVKSSVERLASAALLPAQDEVRSLESATKVEIAVLLASVLSNMRVSV